MSVLLSKSELCAQNIASVLILLAIAYLFYCRKYLVLQIFFCCFPYIINVHILAIPIPFDHFQVKGALLRTLALPESADKHVHIQLLAGLVSTMIDNCPSTPNNAPLSASLKLHQYRLVAPVACRHITDTDAKYAY